MAFTFNHAELAEVALEKGFLTNERVRECLKIEADGTESGSAETFVDILVKKGYLTEQHLNACKRALAGRDKIAGFEMLEMVGRGSMGAVFRAMQTSLDRIVALKVLPKKFSRDKVYVKRFESEARTVARLNHQNIIQGIDVGIDGENMYFAMEFVDGPTVRQMILDRGKIPEAEALKVTLQIARALEHAHKNKLVHRDVKPDNIMLTSEGVAKLCDLGLARHPEMVEGGRAVGTPFYISPEQARGDSKIDIRADIYSLGATLFHMLTGRPPFVGKSSRDVLNAHVSSPAPDVRKYNSKVSLKTAGLVRSMMAKEPAKRPADPAALIADIEKLSGARPKPSSVAVATPARARQSKPHLRAPVRKGSGGVVIVVIIAVVGLAALGPLLATGGGGGPREVKEKKPEVPERHLRAEEMLKTTLDIIDKHPKEHQRNISLLEKLVSEIPDTPSEPLARSRLQAEKEKLADADRNALDEAVSRSGELSRAGKFSEAVDALLALPRRQRTGRLEEPWRNARARVEQKAAEAVEKAAKKRRTSDAVKALEGLRARATERSKALIETKLSDIRKAEADRKKREADKRRRLAEAAAKKRRETHEALVRAVNALTSAGNLGDAEGLLRGAASKGEYRGLEKEVDAEKRDLSALKGLHSNALDKIAANEGLLKLTWKGQSIAGTVEERRPDHVILKTRRGAMIQVYARDLTPDDILILAGFVRTPEEKAKRAAALCGMGLFELADKMLSDLTGTEAARLKRKFEILTGGREAAARAALDAAAKLVAGGKSSEALKALAELVRDYGGTRTVREAADRIAKLRAEARSGGPATAHPDAPEVKVETVESDAGRRAAAGDWRGLTSASVKSIGGGRVRLGYNLADPSQAADWRALSGQWVHSMGALESTSDDDAVVCCRVPFLRVESLNFECASHGASPASIGWTLHKKAEAGKGGAIWGWMRRPGEDTNGGTSLESGGKVLASKKHPMQHRRVGKMSVEMKGLDVTWRLAGSTVLSAAAPELPAGRLVGLGSSAAPGRFDSVTVVGIPDYKAVTAALEKALARAKVEMEASKLPWRNLVDAQAVASWQIRSGQWDVKAGQIEKSGPPRRGPGGRRGGGMNVGGPSLVTSGVKASAFVFEASVWVAARGEGSHRVALVFGSGGDEYSVFQDITANRYYVESSGGKGAAEHIPTADRLETGEEHHMRLTVIGTYVRLDVDGRTKLVAALAKPTKGELGLYAESGNEVRFRDIRARIITE